jgi:hypothetical protein
VITVPNKISVTTSKYSFSGFFKILLSLGLALSSTVAYATFPDITGTYSGTVTAAQVTLNNHP